MCFVGMCPPISADVFTMGFTMHNITTSNTGGRKEMVEMLEFCARNKIGARVVERPLAKVNEVLAELESSKGRALVLTAHFLSFRTLGSGQLPRRLEAPRGEIHSDLQLPRFTGRALRLTGSCWHSRVKRCITGACGRRRRPPSRVSLMRLCSCQAVSCRESRRYSARAAGAARLVVQPRHKITSRGCRRARRAAVWRRRTSRNPGRAPWPVSIRAF